MSVAKKLRRQPLSETVDPAILARAQCSQERIKTEPQRVRGKWFFGNRQSGELRDTEIDVSISEELSILMVEAASIITEAEQR